MHYNFLHFALHQKFPVSTAGSSRLLLWSLMWAQPYIPAYSRWRWRLRKLDQTIVTRTDVPGWVMSGAGQLTCTLALTGTTDGFDLSAKFLPFSCGRRHLTRSIGAVRLKELLYALGVGAAESCSFPLSHCRGSSVVERWRQEQKPEAKNQKRSSQVWVVWLTIWIVYGAYPYSLLDGEHKHCIYVAWSPWIHTIQTNPDLGCLGQSHVKILNLERTH